MADPRAIEHETRRRNLARGVTWRESMSSFDDRGEAVVTYTDRPIWAKSLDSASTLEFEGVQIETGGSRRYLVRYDSRIKATDVIRGDDGVSALVTGVTEIERRRWLILDVGD